MLPPLTMDCPSCGMKGMEWVKIAIANDNRIPYGFARAEDVAYCPTCKTQFPKLECYLDASKQYSHLLQSVLDMRKAQKDYFSHRSDHRLKVALAKESMVDALLGPYVKAGIISIIDTPASKQAGMF